MNCSVGRPAARRPECGLLQRLLQHIECVEAVVARADEDSRSDDDWPRERLRAEVALGDGRTVGRGNDEDSAVGRHGDERIGHEHRRIEELGPGNRSPVLQSATGRVAEDEAAPVVGDADVRADLRAHVVGTERGALVPANHGEAERGAVRGAELHPHGGPHVLEGAVGGAELRPDDGRALVEHAAPQLLANVATCHLDLVPTAVLGR